MTARQITAQLAYQRHHEAGMPLLMPRYTPRGWTECDLVEITRAGYLVEYEVKTSRADFLVDAKKTIKVYGDEIVHLNKHDQIQKGEGPCRFFFVTAPGIVTLGDIPEWAGWMECTEPDRRGAFGVRNPNTSYREGHPFKDRGKPAPRLHNNKVDRQVPDHIRACAAHRFIRMIFDERKIA